MVALTIPSVISHLYLPLLSPPPLNFFRTFAHSTSHLTPISSYRSLGLHPPLFLTILTPPLNITFPSFRWRGLPLTTTSWREHPFWFRDRNQGRYFQEQRVDSFIWFFKLFDSFVLFWEHWRINRWFPWCCVRFWVFAD